ncbi:MAG TPA: branched-chain amino acid ABC transporter permease [Stellaceae bacterium]|nr:branched-chain amino acid ABC transporter permease [Stellaceae bacterium]
MHDVLAASISIAFHGVALAMVLYLVSVGLSITMGLMGFVNLAHGAFAAAGGYIALTLMNDLGVPFPLSLAIAALAVGAVSMLLERLLYSRLYGEHELSQVMFTIGLILVATGGAKAIWGPLSLPMHPPAYLRGDVDLWFRTFPTYRSFLIVAGVVLVTALWLGLERTRFGAQVRAAVDNRRMAQSIGINTSRLFTLTFALGSALAALGGAVGAEIWAIDTGYAQEHLVYFLIVVAVGGLGSIRGPFFASLLLGVSDTAFKYLLPEFGAFFIYALTLVLLLWRPQGLFGRA